MPGDPTGFTPESQYNRAHASMRNVLERCIGVLKSRFRCLQWFSAMLYSPQVAATIIAACAALSNTALEAGEPPFVGDDVCGNEPPAAIVPQVPILLPEGRCCHRATYI
ncbi:hypothetical protein HPB49_000074 [Dermacentor silvarum]|uniref:Uncharacterized protein n=1 Tax=Dermacentor silvarum TaxID=543639 RepID=A0ACB8D1E1_DERSI|nr:hypothetical protein HPB49_000074 [Dermacentor silvarum]